ncbi:hypothetical protein Tco_0885112 [Tanacetum coccineum]
MGRDTIQLEDAVSTISQEYLLEFSSEYYIPENLHPEFPGPGDHIVDFPKGKQKTRKNTPQCYTKPLDSLKNWNNRFFWVDEKVFPTVVAWRMAATKDDKPKANTYSVVDVTTLDTHQIDLFNLIKAPNPTKVKTGTCQRTAHEVPLLTATASCVIQMVDATKLSTSSGTPSTVERSLLDFSNEDVPPPVTQGDAGEGGSNAPTKVLRKDHDAARVKHNARGGKSLANMSVDTEPAIHVHETQEPPIATQSVSDRNPLSYAKPQPNPKQDVAQSSKEAEAARNRDSEKCTPSPSITWSPGSIYQPGWGVPNDYHLDTPEACQDVVDHIAPPRYFFELRHLPTDEFLSQYNINLARQVAMGSQLREKHIKDLEAQLEADINMKKATEVKNSEVTKELEDLRMSFLGREVGNAQLSQRVSVLQAQVMGEERIMATFEVFKKHEDERVNALCAEMDARLDTLSIDFDEELYPHMLTAIAGRWSIIGHRLRLAIMKCAESTELRQAFANVVSAGIAKGMSEGLKYGVEHGKAGLELTTVEAYDPKVDSKYVATFHDLKDLNYPLIDQLEQLKDAPLDVIMASLYLDSDTSEDAPQFIRDLRPSSSQIKIPMYPEVHDPRNPWACKEEILLEDVIAENISRDEKKKKSRVVCRTHGVGSAHHARSDGILVSVPIVAP